MASQAFALSGFPGRPLSRPHHITGCPGPVSGTHTLHNTRPRKVGPTWNLPERSHRRLLGKGFRSGAHTLGDAAAPIEIHCAGPPHQLSRVRLRTPCGQRRCSLPREAHLPKVCSRAGVRAPAHRVPGRAFTRGPWTSRDALVLETDTAGLCAVRGRRPHGANTPSGGAQHTCKQLPISPGDPRKPAHLSLSSLTW